MAVTGLERANSLLITTGKPVESKYGPWSGASIAAAITEAESQVLPLSIRFKGLTVGLIDTSNSGTTVVEYWFESGTANGDLVLKSGGTEVIANPVLSPGTVALSAIKISGTNYFIPSGTVGGSGTVNSIPYWSTIQTLSDSAASFVNAKTVSIKSNLQLLGEGGGVGATAPGNLKFYDKSNTNYVGINGPDTAQDSDSYDLLLPNVLPNVTNQILESNNSGDLSWIPTPTSGTGTVTGTGTAGRLPRWNTTTALNDSSIDETTPGFVEVIKAGGVSATDSVLYMDTTNRRVGFRTISPGAAFDVNGSMRIRNEINVGHTSEQNLFVQGFTNAGGAPIAGNGYVKMGSYGQGNITGSPTGVDQQSSNLRRSAAFGSAGKVVDNYIYDTFEIKISALEQLGTTPLTGKVLVNTPSNLTCLLADFWFYRQINNDSAIGTWGDNTDLVIYPSNDLSGQTIASPYEQGYFRITNDFLSSTATGGSVGASCGLYQGNINGVDQGGMNGAWQIGSNSNQQPLGNKVYLSLGTSGIAPTFPANSQTRFFIGLKYRFLSFQFGVVNNTDLITIEGAAPESCAEYTKCEGTSGEGCNSMLNVVYIPVAAAAGNNPAIIRNNSTGFECCYSITNEEVILPTPNHSITGTFETCNELPKDC